MIEQFSNHNNKGFTLVEVLAALALFVIFISLFYSVYSYMNRSFTMANRQTELQYYSRLAKIEIENEINFVNTMQILTSAPRASDFSSTSQKAIYVNNYKKIVVVTKNSSGNLVEAPLIKDMPDDINMNLSFEKVVKNVNGENIYSDKLLAFTINCSSPDDVASLDSSLLLKDSNDDNMNDLSIGGNSGIAIIFK